MQGWIKLHRKLLENAIFYKPDYFQVWCYILLKVNHEEKKIIWNNQTRVIPKGCGIFSQSKMSKELAISIGSVNNILKFLKAESQIEIKSTNKFTEIQVLKWEEYQDVESKSESQVKASRKQRETNNNDKNENNEKKRGFLPPSIFEVKEYFKENGYPDTLAEKAFKYYETGNWKDSKGNQVKNWKQKMQSVWFKEENKKEKNVAPKKEKVNLITSNPHEYYGIAK